MKLSTSTVHLQRSVPVLALVAALVRLHIRRAEQLRLKLSRKES